MRSFAKSFIFLKFFLQWESLTTSNTIPQIQIKENISKDYIIKNNENYCQKFDLKLTNKNPFLPIMCCLHRTPNGARFIIAFKNCGTKSLSGLISKVFKMLFKHVENFHNKSIKSCKKFIQVAKKCGLWRILLQLLEN